MPEEFLHDWRNMNISNYQLTESDLIDFETILEKIGIKNSEPLTSSSRPLVTKEYTTPSEELSDAIPSIHHDWKGFQQWIFRRLEGVEQFFDQNTNKDFKKVKRNELKFHKIPNQEIQKMFNTAELIFKGFRKLEENVDASPIINQYAKGLETILHEEVSSCFNPLLIKFSKLISFKNTPILILIFNLVLLQCI